MEDVEVLRGLDRPTSPDERYNCPWWFPSRQREEPSLWFHRRPDQKTLTNRQVWRVQQKWTTRQQWWVRQMLCMAQQVMAQQMTSQQVTGQQRGPSWSRMTSQKSWTTWQKLPTQHTIRSQQGTAQHMMMTTRQVWPAQHNIRIRQWTAQQWLMNQWPLVLRQGTLLRQDRIHPCYRMSAVCFSLHCPERSTRLLWLTSCQCGLSCSVGWTRVWLFHMPRPVAQTTAPTPRDDDTPPRRSKTPPRTPDKRPRTPVRRSRTPVRRGRVMDDTRDSTRSRSLIRRSSSSESPPRDASPVNFSAALDAEYKVKDRSITHDEDDDGSQTKVSAAQYQLFRQAVMSSKSSFKVNPAKSRRASRASLMDLGDSEVTDRVSWLDQPSLMDTMASTARIAQRLKEDEEVEKTTLSEMLNSSSSTFKHLTVKQIFPREP